VLPPLLLIDDDRDSLEIRRLIFERAGYDVRTASTPADARDAFLRHPQAAVLLDLRLPGIEDGLALIREFRTHAPGPRIVVLTGCVSDLHNRPEEAMIDAALEKPLRTEQLLRAVAGAMEGVLSCRAHGA
jgi:DNA-binding response OmpR family regulator